MKKILLGFLLVSATCVFAQPAVPISLLQKQKELSIIRSSFEQLHPGLYRFNTVAQINNAFAELETDAAATGSLKEYFLILSKFTAKIKCGHTYLNPWNQKENITEAIFSKTFLPFLHRIIDNKIIITHNLSAITDIKPGDEILSINGIKTARIIDSLLLVSRTDGRNGRGKQNDNLNTVPLDTDTANFALFDIFFPLYFPEAFDSRAYSLMIKRPGSAPKVFTAAALTKKERQQLFENRYGPIPIHETNWSLSFVDTATAYLKLGDFETWEWKADYRKYLDSVFNIIKSRGTMNLIIDVRGNEGGDDDARTEVLSYLIEKPFNCATPMRSLYKFLAIPDSLSGFLKTWSKEIKQPKNPSDYVKDDQGFYERKNDSLTACIAKGPMRNAFRGNKFLLINSNNSSTTFTLADIFQRFSAGKLIGESTGGTKQGINGGQFFFLRLPYSNIEIDLPLIWGAPSETNRPDEGVQPDYKVISTARDIRNGTDPQLKFALALIKRQSR